jgi:hypothetical protein
MEDSTEFFSSALLEGLLTGNSDILKIIRKINVVYTPYEFHKLIERSRRKGRFSVTMCNNSFSTEYRNDSGEICAKGPYVNTFLL